MGVNSQDLGFMGNQTRKGKGSMYRRKLSIASYTEEGTFGTHSLLGLAVLVTRHEWKPKWNGLRRRRGEGREEDNRRSFGKVCHFGNGDVRKQAIEDGDAGLF